MEDAQARLFTTLWVQEMLVHTERAAAANGDPNAGRAEREAMAHLTAMVGALEPQDLEAYRRYRAARLAEIRDLPTE